MMVIPATQTDANEPAHDEASPHPLDALIPDPSNKRPLCDEPRFAAIMESIVADNAPRLFAIVQEYGERVDGRIAAWGTAFEDHAEVVSVDRGLRMSLQAPEDAVRGFTWGRHVRARLVWFNPDAVTPDDDEEDD